MFQTFIFLAMTWLDLEAPGRLAVIQARRAA
jgi:hypothetical protein